MSMFSTVHKAKGLFALDTLIANCWATAVNYGQATTADVLCFQETRVWAAAKDEAEHGRRQKQWTTSISPCVSGPKGGPSAGVAVCTRSHIGMRNSFVEEPKGDGMASRLNVKWSGAVMAGGFHCGSLYMHDGVGIQHETNTKLLHGTAARLCMLQGPWVLSADYNCTPKELAAMGFLKLVAGHIVHPKNKRGTAGKGRLLDFFVVSRDMLLFVHGA